MMLESVQSWSTVLEVQDGVGQAVGEFETALLGGPNRWAAQAGTVRATARAAAVRRWCGRRRTELGISRPY
jgi:hypothetical protein